MADVTRESESGFRALVSDAELADIGIGFPRFHGLYRTTAIAVGAPSLRCTKVTRLATLACASFTLDSPSCRLARCRNSVVSEIRGLNGQCAAERFFNGFGLSCAARLDEAHGPRYCLTMGSNKKIDAGIAGRSRGRCPRSV